MRQPRLLFLPTLTVFNHWLSPFFPSRSHSLLLFPSLLSPSLFPFPVSLTPFIIVILLFPQSTISQQPPSPSSASSLWSWVPSVSSSLSERAATTCSGPLGCFLPLQVRRGRWCKSQTERRVSQLKMRCSVPSSILLSVMNITHAADLTETGLIFHRQEVAAADRVYVAWGQQFESY